MTAGRRGQATGARTRRSAPSRGLHDFLTAFPMRRSRRCATRSAPTWSSGLWMSPMSFNPSSTAFQSHPEWSCAPLGTGTAIANLLTPGDGSNEAGIGLLGGTGRRHPCREPHPYGNRAMGRSVLQVRLPRLARLRRDQPFRHVPVPRGVPRDARPADCRPSRRRVPDRRDERLPALPVRVRGPRAVVVPERAPSSPQLLHNLWSLEPWVPGSSIGQHTFGGDERDERSVDYLMAVALGSH